MTDLSELLDVPDDDIRSRLSAVITKAADMSRSIRKLREDFSLWLQKCDCLTYKKDLEKLDFKNIDDMYELKDESDDFIRSKFQFIDASF